MSLGLVAYGSSDEDSSSEEDIKTSEYRKPTLDANKIANAYFDGNESSSYPQNNHIITSEQRETTWSDDDELLSENRANFNDLDSSPPGNSILSSQSSQDEQLLHLSSGTKLHLPPPKTGTDLHTEGSKEDELDKISLLAGLPAPIVQEVPLSLQDDILEDEVKAKPNQQGEKPPEKKKGPVRITIPSLIEAYDSDEDEPAKKKPKSSKGKSGLFSMLPPPKHSVAKATNRPLIPHAVSKKVPAKAPMPAKPRVPLPAPLQSSTVEKDDASDDDDEGDQINFFALDDADDLPAPINDVLPPLDLSTSGHFIPLQTGGKPLAGPWNTGGSATGLLTVGVQKMDEIAGSHNGQYEGYTHTQNAENYDVMQGEDYAYEQDSEASDELSRFKEDKEFQRVMGRQRGQVNFVEVMGQSHASEVDLLKNLSEETSIKSHSKKKNKDLPSSLQRRKHQITFLTHEAKERELALKNQWSENRMTKRQTQAKYGF